MFSTEEIKKQVVPLCQKHNIYSVVLFGSYARGEADEKSDLDFLVRFGNDDIGLIEFNAAKRDFEAHFGVPVDMITDIPTVQGIDYYARFRDNVAADGVLLYEQDS